MSQAKPAEQSMAVEAVFDRIGAAYDIAFADLPAQDESIDWLLTQLKPRLGQHTCVLDVGCGTGRPVCERIAHAGHGVLGIDISAKMIAAAKEKVGSRESNAHFLQSDQRVFLADAVKKGYTWDAVTTYFSMITSVTQQEIRAFIEEIYEVVKPGGFFVFATVPIDGADDAPFTWMGFPTTVSGMSAKDTVKHIRAVGFEVVFHEVSKFKPKGAGICTDEEAKEETHLFVYAKKPGASETRNA
jgi:SAM-dependent methyltransferase